MLHSPRGIEVDDAPPVPVGGGVCGLCYEDAVAPVTTACGHGFCRECMQNYVESLAAEARAARPNPTPNPSPTPNPNPSPTPSPDQARAACPTCHAALSVDMHATNHGAAA